MTFCLRMKYTFAVSIIVIAGCNRIQPSSSQYRHFFNGFGAESEHHQIISHALPLRDGILTSDALDYLLACLSTPDWGQKPFAWTRDTTPLLRERDAFSLVASEITGIPLVIHDFESPAVRDKRIDAFIRQLKTQNTTLEAIVLRSAPSEASVHTLEMGE